MVIAVCGSHRNTLLLRRSLHSIRYSMRHKTCIIQGCPGNCVCFAILTRTAGVAVKRLASRCLTKNRCLRNCGRASFITAFLLLSTGLLPNGHETRRFAQRSEAMHVNVRRYSHLVQQNSGDGTLITIDLPSTFHSCLFQPLNVHLPSVSAVSFLGRPQSIFSVCGPATGSLRRRRYLPT